MFSSQNVILIFIIKIEIMVILLMSCVLLSKPFHVVYRALKCFLTVCIHFLFFRGQNAKDSESGGGAGGSILIRITTLEGTGTFEVQGGDGGVTSGGGGSGGIVAIYYKISSHQFSYKVRGGGGKKIGASGFLYTKRDLQRSRRQVSESDSVLILEGREVLSFESPSVLVCDPKLIDFTFEEVKLLKSSTLTMISCSQGSPMTLIARTIKGDKTAWLVVKPNHDVYIGVTSIVEPSMELEFNAEIEDGGTLSVPGNFFISGDTQINLSGSLIGVSDLTVNDKGKLVLKYPGHTGFRITPDQGKSVVQISTVRIKDGGSITTTSPSKVEMKSDLLQKDFGGNLGPGISVSSNQRIEHTNGPSLNKQGCPHGYEVVEVASKTLYNPCGVGKHIFNKRNESYLVLKNVSVAISHNETIYVIKNETRFNVTYYIACDYDDFKLLPGQSCNLAPGSYKYNSLEIQGSAAMYFEPGTEKGNASTLSVSKLTIFSQGQLIAKTSNFIDAISTPSDYGGSYGGLGGGASENSALYGNISFPVDYGSNGGGSSQNHGWGGGVIILKTTELFNDGLIDASGGDGSSGAGAGSGGSIQVVTDYMKGSGIFRARGGNANFPAGGGGGGRVGITIRKGQSEFRGLYDATGGDGRRPGSSGTVFVRDQRQGASYEMIMFWNKIIGYPPAQLPNTSAPYTYDEIRLENRGTFLATAQLVVAKSFVTDGTGKLTISGGARVDILSFSKSSRTFSCDLEIQAGGSLYFYNQPIFLGPGSPTVVVAGILDAREPSVGKGKSIKITSTGEIRLDKLRLLKDSVMRVDSDASIKKSFSYAQFHLTSLRLDTNAQLIFAQENVSLRADLIHLSQGAAITSDTDTKFINITSNDILIDNQARITADEGGFLGGPGKANGSGSGCGHGGRGGGGQGGESYGSVFEPQHYGSGNNARGGGVIFLNIKGGFTLYGSVSANGANDSRGGASGGSILVHAGTLSGHGEVLSNGGEGLSNSAGGSGGRIALYITDRTSFKGVLTTYGGCGTTCAAAGTIFIREYVVGLPQNSTVIDNGDRKTEANTIIMHEMKISYTMRLLKLVNGARLEVATVPNVEMKIAIQNLEGDGSGSFHVHHNQTLTLGAGKAVSSRPFMFPWAMIVDEGATLNLDPVLFITRTAISPSLYLAGKLTGGEKVTVGQDASVVIAKSGVIGTHSNTPGKYSFLSLKVSSGGRITIEVDEDANAPVELKSLSVDVAFGGVIIGRYLRVDTSLLNIAFSGTLQANGLGNLAGVGPGAGSSSLLTGGGYGGCGGGNTNETCVVYGSLFEATEFGSGGGTTQVPDGIFGSGGGIIEVEAQVLIVDGTISSNGESGSSTTGGGSGGSVDISISQTFSGRGKIKAEGGYVSGQVTGAGGGGRISILITGDNKFSGSLSARGGSSSAKSGSPGTVYTEDGKTVLRKRKLFLDNGGISSNSPLPIFLNQSVVASYDFQEIHLNGLVMLHVDKDMEVEKLVTDSDSVIYIKDNVTFTVEPNSKYLQPDCSFIVDANGEIRIPDKVMFLGRNNIFKGTLTGILDMVIGENRKVYLLASARTARYIDGKYTFITHRGEYRFSSLRIKNGAFFSFENAHLKKVPLTLGRLEVNFGASMQGSWLDIKASDVIIHSGATIDLSAQGYKSDKGPGAGGLHQSDGTGAGHGGYGGISTVNFGKWYGSALNPNNTGSGGGSSSSGKGGKGGGYLRLTVVRLLTLEGTISVDGDGGTVLNSGGGSGGSIWISADNIQGNGIISAEGGDGNGTGGGGSGGRVALYLQGLMSFEGLLNAKGGDGKDAGAAGTLYIQDNNKRIPRKRLWIDNLKVGNNKPQTVLYEADRVNFLFDELRLNGMSRFEIYNLQRKLQTIQVTNFISDGVGEIAIRKNQTLLAEVLEAKESHLTLTTNIYVEEGANLVVASNLTIDGATLTLDGKLSNVRHLVVESGSAIKFGVTSQTTLMENKNFVFQSDPGTQQFASVTLKSGSDFGAPLNLKLSVGKLNMKSGVILQGKFVDIKSQSLLIGRGATLTTNDIMEIELNAGGRGHSSSNGGSGGGHGSIGGTGYNTLAGGIPYGTIYEPNQPGSPGGDGGSGDSGGKGGGVISIDTDILENDGSITANGGDASQSSQAGGGSGGSVYIIASSVFSGTGTVSAHGGRGDGAGGCGAGGRVAIHLKSQYAYRGTLEALGGISSSSGASGGPGTVYIKDVRYKLYFEQLHVDNQGQSWQNYVTLNESKTSYHFHELHLVHKASLRMTPSSNLTQSSTLSIGKLFGDRSGLLHLYNGHKAIIEVVEAQLTTTKTPVNLRIDSGAEAVMATTVYIVGDGAVALHCNGTLNGVRNLYVTQKRVVLLEQGSRTLRDDEQPGTFMFSNVKLFSGSSVTMKDEIVMKIIAGFLNIKFHASLEAHYFDIVTSNLDVETGGLLSVAGDNKARLAVEPSEVSSLPQGAGAGHASNGGSGYGGAAGGLYHGSLYKPKESGRRGGKGTNNGIGGRGGGYVKIEAGTLIINDGIITVEGGSAVSGGGAGGGSGGSLLFNTESFIGKSFPTTLFQLLLLYFSYLCWGA